MSKLLFPAMLAFAIAGSAACAVAQDKVDGKTTQELQKQDTVPPATSQHKSEQSGTQEPSSKVKNPGTDENVFTNGVLTVPGAPTDSDTAPAKFSARNADDDVLPIAGYRLKNVSAAQTQEIVKGLGPQQGNAAPTSMDGNAVVGAEVPAAIAFSFLKPTPDALTARFPELQGTGFMRAAGRVLIVDLDNSVVVGVF